MTSLTRVFSAALVLICAAAIAAGCGQSSDAAAGGSGFFPEHAFLGATMSIDLTNDGELHDAREVLERVPAFSLVKGQIPNEQAIVDMLAADSGNKVDYAKDIKPWLGKQAGFGMWFKQKKAKTGEKPTGVLWAEVTDEDKAVAFLKKQDGAKKAKTYKGIELWAFAGEGEDGYAFVTDETILLATSKAAAEASVRAHEGDSLEESDEYGALIDREGRTELLSMVANGKAIMEYAQTSAGKKDPKIAELLKDDAIRDLVPNWIAFSVGTDKTGGWMDIAYSTDADLGGDADARQRAEKMPKESINAVGFTGSPLSAYVDVWKAARETYDLSAANVAKKCPAAYRSACANAYDLLEYVVSDDFQEQSKKASGDHGVAFAQLPGATPSETVVVGSMDVEDRDAYEQLTKDLGAKAAPLAKDLGIGATRKVSGDEATTTVTIQKTSPFYAVLQQVAAQPGQAMLAGLLKSGLTMVERFDDGVVYFASPASAAALIDQMQKGGSTLQDNDKYSRDIKASDPTDESSFFAWLDLAAVVEPTLQQVAPEALTVAQAQLEHVGGPVMWNGREKIGGSTYATFTLEVPLYE